MGHDAHLDLAVVGESAARRNVTQKVSRIRRPASVRTGMFCRLGSVDDSRPVAAMVWLKVVWIRPSAATDFRESIDGDLEPGGVAVGQ